MNWRCRIGWHYRKPHHYTISMRGHVIVTHWRCNRCGTDDRRLYA